VTAEDVKAESSFGENRHYGDAARLSRFPLFSTSIQNNDMTINYLDRNSKFLLLCEEKVADGGTRYLPLQNFYRRRMTEEVKILRIAGNRKRYDVSYQLFRQPTADTFSSQRKRNFYPATLSAFCLLPSAFCFLPPVTIVTINSN
jgi:hypothetical protein